MKITRRQLRKIISENIFSDLASNAYEYMFGSEGDSEKGASEANAYTPGQVVTTSENDPYEYKEENNTWVFRKKGSSGSWKNINKEGSAVLNREFKSDSLQRTTDKKSEKIKEGGYEYEISSDGKLFVLSKDRKAINKELTGTSKTNAIKVLRAYIKSQGNEDSYPILFSEKTKSDKADKSIEGIEYFPGYDAKIIGNFQEPKSDYDMTVGACSEDGCAQFVSDTLGPEEYVGNAWHAHARYKNKFTAFENLSEDDLAAMGKLFTSINKNPKEGSKETEVRNIVFKLLPSQNSFSNLSLGDVVGLTYGKTTNWTKAFFEGATGRKDMGTGRKDAPGPYFVRKETGDPWKPEDIGKNIEFIPGKTLNGGGGFGMNTHIGIIGAKHDGVPIVYHNIHRVVKATGLNAMKKNGTMIVFAGSKKV